MTQARILVVEDDDNLLLMISDALKIGGYQVLSASNGHEANQKLRESHFDLVVTDINMPKMDGYQLLESMRNRKDETPAIFLTARNDKPDVNRGLKVGADDYITKPFGLEELTLRIAAILRRTMPKVEQEPLMCGPVLLDDDSHLVTVNSHPVDLSPTEFRLLEYLMENKNRVLTKHALLDRVWGIDFSDSATVVDTYISYLRKKIHTDNFHGIKTVRGIGFQIVDDE
jgi:two-component system OmpR family response regulator